MTFKNLLFPIIQAPMAGGVATSAMAIAVSRNGGLGFLAAGYKTTEALEEEIKACVAAGITYGVNLFVPANDAYDEKELYTYKEKLQQDFKLALTIPTWTDDEWIGKLALVEHYKVPFVSFTFGCPKSKVIERLQVVGCTIIITVTNVEEAILAQAAGANAVCLQGINAGGHRGSFHNIVVKDTPSMEQQLLEVRQAISLPIIAAGGIMNGRDINALLELGANAVQLGTAFICCEESGANAVYKRALLEGAFTETTLTRAFTGRFARGLKNDFIQNYEAHATDAYPTLHYVTQPIRKRALEQENPQAMSLWAGTGFKQALNCSVQQLMKRLVDEMQSKNI